jgi:hypothetical protein
VSVNHPVVWNVTDLTRLGSLSGSRVDYVDASAIALMRPRRVAFVLECPPKSGDRGHLLFGAERLLR